MTERIVGSKRRSERLRGEPFGYEWPGSYFMGDEELEYVSQVVRASSPFRHYGLDLQHMCDLFESEFASYCGSAHALAVSSGTAALKVAMAALGIGPGQEVIIPGYMWISTVAAVVQSGAIPVLCEIDETFALDPKDLVKRITSRTTAIIHVHMSGATGHIEEVLAIARQKKLRLVEDCAQAAGGSYKGKKLGTFGDIGTFSFQYNKAMTTGEGGMVVTDDELLFKRCQAAQDIGHSRNLAGRLIVDPQVLLWGFGTRMSELQGAVGRAQLKKLDLITKAMRDAKMRLKESLRKIEGLSFRTLEDPLGDNGAFLITLYRDGETARKVAAELAALGLRGGEGSLLLSHFDTWGFHLYYNLPALVRKASTSPDGFPWTHPLNAGSNYYYDKGALPQTDGIFERSMIQAIPSNLTDRDVQDLIRIYLDMAREIL
ncbi:MAG: DegT/DnrJ/EryC1/StrS family aminotransferase [Spirochaetia bacterium]|jgi:8-amino-3,8-dideoxy-alpha-D-manno-octulosonate transaminase